MSTLVLQLGDDFTCSLAAWPDSRASVAHLDASSKRLVLFADVLATPPACTVLT